VDEHRCQIERDIKDSDKNLDGPPSPAPEETAPISLNVFQDLNLIRKGKEGFTQVLHTVKVKEIENF